MQAQHERPSELGWPLMLYQFPAVYLKPFGPAFKPAGKNTPTAGLTAVVPFTAPPPVTMFSTCVVLRANATTLVASASVMRVAVALPPAPRVTENVARPKSSGLESYGPGATPS